MNAGADEDPRARRAHRGGCEAQPDRPHDHLQDVAAAIVALSGAGTGFINGEIIGVDGGESIAGA